MDPRERRRGEEGGIGRVFLGLLSAAMVIGLGGAVIMLMGELNARRYKVSRVGDQIVIQRGAQLPFGFELFKPKGEDLQTAYAPIPLPAGEAYEDVEVYEDRADLDRALFATMAGWARTRMTSDDPQAFELAVTYVNRCELLPGLSEEQRLELRTLRADLAYRKGRRLIAQAAGDLERALVELRRATELGAARAGEAEQWARELEQRIGGIQTLSDGLRSERPEVRAAEPPPPANQTPGGGKGNDWRL